MFLRNIGSYLRDHMALLPGHLRSHEKLTPHAERDITQHDRSEGQVYWSEQSVWLLEYAYYPGSTSSTAEPQKICAFFGLRYKYLQQVHVSEKIFITTVSSVVDYISLYFGQICHWNKFKFINLTWYISASKLLNFKAVFYCLQANGKLVDLITKPLKPKILQIILKNPVCTLKKTQRFSIIEIKWLIGFN